MVNSEICSSTTQIYMFQAEIWVGGTHRMPYLFPV